MKTIGWGIVVAGFMIGYGIEWASGREKTDCHKATDGGTFLLLLLALIIVTVTTG